MKHPVPCLDANPGLEQAAHLAEQRKNQALDRLNEKLSATPEKDAFLLAMENLIDADKAVMEAKRR